MQAAFDVSVHDEHRKAQHEEGEECATVHIIKCVNEAVHAEQHEHGTPVTPHDGARRDFPAFRNEHKCDKEKAGWEYKGRVAEKQGRECERARV